MCNVVERFTNEGILIGFERGMEEGIEKGIKTGRNAMIFDMLQSGLSYETVAKIAHSSVADIQNIAAGRSTLCST